MTLPLKSGGPAFPVDCSFFPGDDAFKGRQTGNSSGFAVGVSVRDYFAAAVLQGMQANPEFLQAVTRSPRDGTCAEQCAAVAYRYADAMLAERAK